MTRGAVGNWELGKGVKLENLLQLADLLDVNFLWLSTGQGSPRRTPAVGAAWRADVTGRVGAGAIVDSFDLDEKALRGRETVELPPDTQIKALIVEGDSMRPYCYPGEIILYDTRPRLPVELIDRYAIAEFLDGRQKIKILRHGRNRNSWRLDSHNAEPEEDVVLRAAFRVVGRLAQAEEADQTPPVIVGMDSKRPRGARSRAA